MSYISSTNTPSLSSNVAPSSSTPGSSTSVLAEHDTPSGSLMPVFGLGQLFWLSWPFASATPSGAFGIPECLVIASTINWHMSWRLAWLWLSILWFWCYQCILFGNYSLPLVKNLPLCYFSAWDTRKFDRLFGFVYLLTICLFSVVVVSIGRVVALYRLGTRMDTDFTYVSAEMYYWYVAEMSIAMLGICLPSIFNLANRFRRGGAKALISRNYEIPSKQLNSWKSSSKSTSRKGSTFHTQSRTTTLHDHTTKDNASTKTEEQQLCWQETIVTTDNPINPNAPDQQVLVKVDIETKSVKYKPDRYAPPKTPWE